MARAREEPPAHPDAGGEGKDETLDKLTKRLYERADALETKLNVGAGNGLFEDQDVVKHEQVLRPLMEVIKTTLQKDVTPEQYSDALSKLDQARHLYEVALGAVPTRKKLYYVYGVPALAYLLVALLVAALLDLWLFPGFLPNGSFASMPLQILVAGSAGAILRGIVALWNRVDMQEYRKIWSVWFVLSPFTGALLGGIVYLAFYVGIAVTTSGATITNEAALFLVAILAGYNWEWANKVLAAAAAQVGPKSDG